MTFTEYLVDATVEESGLQPVLARGTRAVPGAAFRIVLRAIIPPDPTSGEIPIS